MLHNNCPVRSLGIRSACGHLLSILAIAMLVALSPRDATAACTGPTDAQQPLNPNLVALVYDQFVNNNTNITHGVAQVFTAQYTGTLQGVTLNLERFNVPGIVPRFYLWTTDASGVPVSSGATVLASVVLNDFAINQPAGPKDVCVVLSVPVLAGTEYAFGIVAGGTQSTAPPTRGLKVYGKSGNPYSGKTYNFDGPNALSNGDDFGNFQERLDGKDIKFIFYTDAVVPTPTPTATPFNSGKAKQYKTWMVRAFPDCTGPTTTINGGLPACAPPVPLSPYSYNDCTGWCRVQIDRNPQPLSCNCKIKVLCRGILDPNGIPFTGPGFTLDMVWRETAGATGILFPITIPLSTFTGSINHQTDCNTIFANAGLSPMPPNSSVEINDVAISDPDSNRFAVPGFNCCGK